MSLLVYCCSCVSTTTRIEWNLAVVNPEKKPRKYETRSHSNDEHCSQPCDVVVVVVFQAVLLLLLSFIAAAASGIFVSYALHLYVFEKKLACESF